MHAFLLLCINQYTKFVEEPGFTYYNDMIRAKVKNGSHDFDHALILGSLSPWARI